MVQDTIEITTQTLKLKGFTIWNTRAKFDIKRILAVGSAAENYSFAADDLLNLCNENGPARCECARLLQYYSAGFTQAFDTAPKDIQDGPAGQKLRKCTLDIDSALAATGIDLPPMEEEKSFEIPNGSISELLIKSLFESTERPPTTLGKLETSTHTTYIKDEARSGSRRKD